MADTTGPTPGTEHNKALRSFQTGFQYYSDREKPDFANSIKESILAVEAACKHLAGSKKGTLNTALSTLNKRRPLHPAFKEGLEKLYAWTGDEDGVRHATMVAEKVERADAQFMLVACSPSLIIC